MGGEGTGGDRRDRRDRRRATLTTCARSSALTLATHTIPGPGGAQPIKHDSDSADCAKLSLEATKFRQVVHEAIGLFSARLSTLIAPKLSSGAPLLATPDGHDFSTFADVVEAGEHLEHFHSYSKKATASVEPTIETHTDQGLFIVFTPALMLGADGMPTTEAAADFYIEMADGSTAKARCVKGGGRGERIGEARVGGEGRCTRAHTSAAPHGHCKRRTRCDLHPATPPTSPPPHLPTSPPPHLPTSPRLTMLLL